jgi:hypothetical protein
VDFFANLTSSYFTLDGKFAVSNPVWIDPPFISIKNGGMLHHMTIVMINAKHTSSHTSKNLDILKTAVSLL